MFISRRRPRHDEREFMGNGKMYGARLGKYEISLLTESFEVDVP